MKYILVKIILFTLVISIPSCNKFLEENPKSQIASDSYFKTSDQVKSAVNQLYHYATGPELFYVTQSWYDATWAFYFDIMSGLTDNPVQQDVTIKYFAMLSQNQDNLNGFSTGIWTSFYASINIANTIISKVENSATLDASTKAQALATAKFFRAADYYYLVRLFGGVPLVLEPISSLDNIYPGRASVEEVYKVITDDLEWAKNNGNLADVPMGSNNNRISKGTVACFLSEAYLTMAGYPLKKTEYYSKALTTAKSIIDSPGGYKLFDNSGGTTPFDKLRLTDFDKGSEYLYYFEYDPAIQSTWYPIWSFPASFPKKIPKSDAEIKYSVYVLSWKPTKPLLNLYDDANDIRRQNRQFYHDKFPYKTNDGKYNTIEFEISPFRWYDSLAIFVTGISGKYTPAYRLADVYLIAAEAANEMGDDPTPYLTPITNRAYKVSPPIPAGQTNRRNLILGERFRELAMENHFWFDMLRTRLYPEADAQHRVTFSPLIGHNNGRGQKYSEKDLLIPLPLSEMQRNSNLKPQNPGY